MPTGTAREKEKDRRERHREEVGGPRSVSQTSIPQEGSQRGPVQQRHVIRLLPGWLMADECSISTT